MTTTDTHYRLNAIRVLQAAVALSDDPRSIAPIGGWDPHLRVAVRRALNTGTDFATLAAATGLDVEDIARLARRRGFHQVAADTFLR